MSKNGDDYRRLPSWIDGARASRRNLQFRPPWAKLPERSAPDVVPSGSDESQEPADSQQTDEIARGEGNPSE
jgi:hypothetical protein